jgi:hypothetical protein
MLAEKDKKILKEAGITDLDELARAAAAFLRTHPLLRIKLPPNGLSAQEVAFLNAGGAVGAGSFNQKKFNDNIATIAAEYAQMVATSLTLREAAELLSVSPSRVRQRIDDGSLYAIEGPSGRVCPKFQFSDKGTLPGLEQVLSAIDKQAHPVAVQRFFLTPSQDLEPKNLNQSLTPREWLISGYPSEAVVVLAQDL